MNKQIACLVSYLQNCLKPKTSLFKESHIYVKFRRHIINVTVECILKQINIS